MKSGGLFLALMELKYGSSSLIGRTGGSSSNLKGSQTLFIILNRLFPGEGGFSVSGLRTTRQKSDKIASLNSTKKRRNSDCLTIKSCYWDIIKQHIMITSQYTAYLPGKGCPALKGLSLICMSRKSSMGRNESKLESDIKTSSKPRPAVIFPLLLYLDPYGNTGSPGCIVLPFLLCKENNTMHSSTGSRWNIYTPSSTMHAFLRERAMWTFSLMKHNKNITCHASCLISCIGLGATLSCSARLGTHCKYKLRC